MMYWINSGYKCRVSDRGAHFLDRRPVLCNNILIYKYIYNFTDLKIIHDFIELFSLCCFFTYQFLFICYPQICLGPLDRSLCDMRTAPDQYPFLVRTALSPQAGTCFHRYHPTHYYTQGTREIQK